MKLKSAHIRNFGKLSNLDFDFSEGLNCFNHENGWGKTTLAVFIKSMLYGLSASRKQSLKENELNKYAPWQGGVYGGFLTFEHGGKEYRVARTFGKNESFELLDLKTNKISSDFSSDLGTEIYGVNKETYERSVHVTLDESPVLSSDISAKLNNLVESGDVGDFDKADKLLEDRAKKLKFKKGDGGEISETQKKIDNDREILGEIASLLIQNEDFEKKISETENKIAALKKEQDELSEKIAVCAKYEGKLRYDQLKNNVDSAKKTKSEIEDFFDGNIPDETVIKSIDLLTTEYSTLESNIKNASMSQSEKENYISLKESFSGDIPTSEQIRDCIKADSDYKEYKRLETEKKLNPSESAEFSELEKKFSGKNINIDECMKDFSEIQNVALSASRLENEKQGLETDLKIKKSEKPKNALRFVLLGGAGLFLILGAALIFVLGIFMVGIVGIALGLSLFVASFAFKGKTDDFSSLETKISEIESEIEKMLSEKKLKEEKIKSLVRSVAPETSENEIDAALLSKISVEYNRYETLKNKNDEFESWKKSFSLDAEDIENKLKAFLKRYCKSEDLSAVTSEINILDERLSKLHRLEEKLNSDSENIKKFAEVKEKLFEILEQYKTEKTLSYPEQVQEIHSKLNGISIAEKTIEDAKNRVAAFEKDSKNDVENFKNLEKPELSADELNAKMRTVQEKIGDAEKTLAAFQKNLSDNLLTTDKKEDIESELENLSALKKEKEAQYDLLLKTRQFLTEAKEKLDENYSDPMKEGFEKYIKMLGGKLKLVIDTDLKVSVDDSGLLRETEYLSEGYKDMVNFCSRMALVSSLFKEAKPAIILDDPFVNLDDEKIPNAIEFVKEISKENQVLYFTCHESRAV